MAQRRYRLVVGNGEIEALELTPENGPMAVTWTDGLEVVEIDPFNNHLRFVALNIPTAEEILRASQGDFIIRDAMGNLSVMGPNEFQNKYVPSENETRED